MKIRRLQGEWTSYIEPSRWNWSYYLGWFLLPSRKGLPGIIDKLRERWVNKRI